MGEDALGDRIVLESPSKDEVAIRNRVPTGEGDVDATDALRTLQDLVQRRLDRGDRNAPGVEADVDRDVVAGPLVRTDRHRRDPARIRNLIGVRGEAVSGCGRFGKPPDEPTPRDLTETVRVEREGFRHEERVPALTAFSTALRSVVHHGAVDHHRHRVGVGRGPGSGDRRTIDPDAGGQRLEDPVGAPGANDRRIEAIRRLGDLPLHPGRERQGVRAPWSLEELGPELRITERDDAARTSENDAASNLHVRWQSG